MQKNISLLEVCCFLVCVRFTQLLYEKRYSEVKLHLPVAIYLIKCSSSRACLFAKQQWIIKKNRKIETFVVNGLCQRKLFILKPCHWRTKNSCDWLHSAFSVSSITFVIRIVITNIYNRSFKSCGQVASSCSYLLQSFGPSLTNYTFYMASNSGLSMDDSSIAIVLFVRSHPSWTVSRCTLPFSHFPDWTTFGVSSILCENPGKRRPG